MFDHTIVITNRALVEGDYLEQIKRVTALRPCALILREKDLSAEEYEHLAEVVYSVCRASQTQMFVHTSIATAVKIGCRAIHISVSNIDSLQRYMEYFDKISVSCHSMDDVKKAIDGGATQIILGTIFETDCKKGLKGKGTEFVREIADYVKIIKGDIPVYAIGGISPENIGSVIDAGAAGGCMMSYMMRYRD